MANELEACCNHKKNDRFKVMTLRVADFFKSLLSSILKICISCVYIQFRGWVARSGQSTPEVFQQELSESKFWQSTAKTFWHFPMVLSPLVWEINQNITDEMHVLSTMGVNKESISKFLIGNQFHVKLRILSPCSNRIYLNKDYNLFE